MLTSDLEIFKQYVDTDKLLSYTIQELPIDEFTVEVVKINRNDLFKYSRVMFESHSKEYRHFNLDVSGSAEVDDIIRLLPKRCYLFMTTSKQGNIYRKTLSLYDYATDSIIRLNCYNLDEELKLYGFDDYKILVRQFTFDSKNKIFDGIKTSLICNEFNYEIKDKIILIKFYDSELELLDKPRTFEIKLKREPLDKNNYHKFNMLNSYNSSDISIEKTFLDNYLYHSLEGPSVISDDWVEYHIDGEYLTKDEWNKHPEMIKYKLKLLEV